METRILKTVSFQDAKGNTQTFKTLCTQRNIEQGFIKISGGGVCKIID